MPIKLAGSVAASLATMRSPGLKSDASKARGNDPGAVAAAGAQEGDGRKGSLVNEIPGETASRGPANADGLEERT